MAIFYMNLRRKTGLAIDEEGSDFSSLTTAHEAALAALCEIAADRLRAQEAVHVTAIEITDDAGTVLDVVPLSAAIRTYLPEP